jgi:hypothetical protein
VVSGGADDADEAFWKNESTVVASNERALVTVSNRLDRGYGSRDAGCGDARNGHSGRPR